MAYGYAQNALPPVPETVVQAALEYAWTEYGVRLNEQRLRLLYDKTRARRSLMKCPFNIAKHWALRQILTEQDHEAQQRYRAYSAALGKMGNGLRQLSQAKPKQPRKRTPLEQIKDRVTLGRDGKQYEFILS